MTASKAALLGVLSLFIVFLLWKQLSPPSPPRSTISPPLKDQSRLRARIDALEDALFAEQVKTRELAQRLTQLEQQNRSRPSENLSDEPTAATEKTAQPDMASMPTRVIKRPPTLQQKLLAAGLAQDAVERITRHIGENRLALLELRNRAIREDWMDTPEYVEQMQQLRNPAQGIREQEGDAVYDQYLYVAGRPNRVLVTEVYPGSTAQQAGIQPHDVILSYAQQRIFSMRELQRATTEGDDGEMVLVELLRDGQRLDTSVERGPLGIALTATRLPPE